MIIGVKRRRELDRRIELVLFQARTRHWVQVAVVLRVRYDIRVDILLRFGAGGRGGSQSVVVSCVELFIGDFVLVFEGVKALLHAGA
jgi:hypothetical protein